MARSKRSHAAVAMDQGDFERAERHQEESVALKRRSGDRAGVATSLHNLRAGCSPASK